MRVYQLCAEGTNSVLGDSERILSRYAFTTRDDAERYAETFRQQCMTPKTDGDMNYFSEATVLIVPLQVIESSGICIVDA